MVTHQEVTRQLKAIGANFRWWGRGEARELEHILVPGETIMYCMNGRYTGGFAMLCITDQRAVLIDKKPMFLTLEDIRFDMVSEVDFSQRLFDASIHIFSLNKKFTFSTLGVSQLRKATSYFQHKVLELRQQQVLAVQGAEEGVTPIMIRITNPYTKVPLMMRRRASCFYSN